MKRLRAEGREVFHFGFGESPFSAPMGIQRALSQQTFRKSYLSAQGLYELRAAVAGFYQRHFDVSVAAEQILVGPGSKELLFILLSVLEGPLLLPTPRWVSYAPQAQLAGKPVIDLPTQFETEYKLQPETLEQVLLTLPPEQQGQQKLLLLNSPCNPTGAVYTRAELEALVAVAREHQVLIISDEIYALVSFEPFVSLASLYPEGCIVTGGLSKDRSLGGYRLGIALFPEGATQALKAAVAMATETFSCVAAPIQYAACTCTAYAPNPELEAYMRRCRRLHERVLRFTHARIQEMGLRCLSPAGAFYLFPDFSAYRSQIQARGLKDDLDLGQHILAQTGVGMLAGQYFGCSPQALAFRLSPVDYAGQSVYEADERAFEDLSQTVATAEAEAFVRHYCPRIDRGCAALATYLADLSS